MAPISNAGAAHANVEMMDREAPVPEVLMPATGLALAMGVSALMWLGIAGAVHWLGGLF